MKRWTRADAVGLMLVAAVWCAIGIGAVMAADRKPIVFVDPQLGNDSNTGTQAFPFRTMHRAGQWVASQSPQRCTVRVEGY